MGDVLMKKIIRLSLWFLVGVLLSSWAIFAHAASCATVISACNAQWSPNTCKVYTATSPPHVSSVTTGGAEWVLFGSCDACPTGQTVNETTGACSVPCVANQTISTGYYDLGTDENALPATTTCNNGCEAGYNGSGVVRRSFVNGVYHYWATGSYVTTGGSCTSGNPSPTGVTDVPPNTCDSATQDAGTVNGVSVCLNRTTNTPKTTTTSTDPVTGDTTTTTTTTTPDGTQITETMTSHTDSTTGNTTITGNTQTTPAPFCQQHPSDPTCQGTSDFCSKNPGSIACTQMGAPPVWTEPAAGTMPNDPTVAQVGQGGILDWHNAYLPENASCPFNDIPLTVMGVAVDIPLSKLCPYLETISHLIIGLSVLVSIRLFAMAPW